MVKYDTENTHTRLDTPTIPTEKKAKTFRRISRDKKDDDM